MTTPARRRSRHNALRSRRLADSENIGSAPTQQSEVQMSVQGAARRIPATRSRQAQQDILDQIKELILTEGLAAGDPMPTEAELVDRLGVSRNSVREALKALQAIDLVEIRHGFGTYVGTCSLTPFSEALIFRGRRSLRGDRHDVYEIVDLREALEAGLVGQLISVIGEDDLRELRLRLAELKEVAGQGQAGDDADRAFHEQLFAPLENQLTSQLLRVFWDVYHELADELPPSGLDPDDIYDIHAAIYAAVADRDADRAARAIHDHFVGIRERIRG
ncbi:FadR/GntR family transcriptional regulator [Nocardioides sp. DS6]|uniref:FadR/GntR family transcriptional regulator n=1 Tax=Nocardioides eburneus TaxID=3231482 RepID=A0ABV3SY51_9ACTN